MIVVDTSTLIAGLRSATGASAEVLRLVLRGELAAGASTNLLFEYEAVATRPEHLAASCLSSGEVAEFLDALAIALHPTYIRWRVRPASPDPDDDLVIEAAVNCSADYIVTLNTRDIADAAARFGIRTVTPHMLLALLRTSS